MSKNKKKCLQKFADMQKIYIFVGSIRHNNKTKRYENCNF